MQYPPLSSALILMNTGSSGGRGSMAGDVHEVLKKLRKLADEHIDLAHLLLGPTDMIAHVHAENFEALLNVIDEKIFNDSDTIVKNLKATSRKKEPNPSETRRKPAPAKRPNRPNTLKKGTRQK